VAEAVGYLDWLKPESYSPIAAEAAGYPIGLFLYAFTPKLISGAIQK
jgi:hypothetical protein